MRKVIVTTLLELALLAIATLFVTGCGGGGGGNSSGNSTSYVTWANNSNGTVIKDGANNNFSVDATSRKVVSLTTNSVLSGLTVDNNGNVINNGVTVAAVVLDTSTVGSKIAIFSCSGPAPQFGAMTINETSAGWSYTCASASGSGGGSTNYVSWSGNANGTTIVDAANNLFAVDASTREVVALASNTILTGLTVNSLADVLYNGGVIGSVASVASTSGSQIAEFFCSNGNPMTISVSTTWTTSCGGNGTGSTGGGTAKIVPVNNCIYLKNVTFSNLPYLANQCSFRIEVEWKDQGNCMTGCAWAIGPNTYTSAGNGIKGTVNYVACPSPAIPNLALGTCH